MTRKDLSQHKEAARHGVYMETYRDQLASVAIEPSSEWMDQRCKRYSLRWLLFHTVHEDRAHRKARGYADGR